MGFGLGFKIVAAAPARLAGMFFSKQLGGGGGKVEKSLTVPNPTFTLT